VREVSQTGDDSFFAHRQTLLNLLTTTKRAARDDRDKDGHIVIVMKSVAMISVGTGPSAGCCVRCQCFHLRQKLGQSDEETGLFIRIFNWEGVEKCLPPTPSLPRVVSKYTCEEMRKSFF